MRILILTHSFNCLTQKIFAELKKLGHELSVEYDISDQVTESAVAKFKPDVLIAPFLKRAIPQSVWENTLSLIIHPGPPGDRGPSSLDWAILNNESHWGVTIIEANAILDGGSIWAYKTFSMPKKSKGTIYRQEVSNAALEATLLALAHFEDYKNQRWTPQSSENFIVNDRPSVKQSDRKIHWEKDTKEEIIRKINSADGTPGVYTKLGKNKFYLYEAYEYPYSIEAEIGTAAGICDFGVIVNTINGPITIGHLKEKSSNELPSFKKSARHFFDHLPNHHHDRIRLEIKDNAVWIYFHFYNGAFGIKECRDLHRAFLEAASKTEKIIIFKSENDFFSNGIHLNEIEASKIPADYAWENIKAMNDLIHEILTNTKKLTVALVDGNASAGGIVLARACDILMAHKNCIFNPHYKNMGNLYGSEFWTYLFPKYLGEKETRSMMSKRHPMEVEEAKKIGLVDQIGGYKDFLNLYHDKIDSLINEKKEIRIRDEKIKPLLKYAEEELKKMKDNFYGFDPSFHVARYNFVRHIPKSKTPLHLAVHRNL